MSSLQVASLRPQICLTKLNRMSGVSSVRCSTTAHVWSVSRSFPKPTICSIKYKRCPPVRVFEDSGKSEFSNQEPLENPVGETGKKLSLEEILRRQIEKQEYDLEGDGDGGSPPSDGGGRGRRGRGGGGGADFGGSEEEMTPAERLDELLQVTLATIGLILLYLYILHGPEINRLTKDYFRYLLTGSRSVRLKRSMYAMTRFFQSLTQKKKVVKPEDSMALLQREILRTPTWFDSPSKYEHIVKSYMAYKLED